MNLKELKEKYPSDTSRFKQKPMPDCPQCKGTGEHSDTRNEIVWCGCMALPTGLPEEKRLNIMQHLEEIKIKAKDTWTQHVELASKTKSKTKKK
jgi:hypothetical protein